MSTRDFSWGKGGRCWRPTTLVVPNVKKIRGLNLPGTSWPTSVCCGRPLPLYVFPQEICIYLVWQFLLQLQSYHIFHWLQCLSCHLVDYLWTNTSMTCVHSINVGLYNRKE